MAEEGPVQGREARVEFGPGEIEFNQPVDITDFSSLASAFANIQFSSSGSDSGWTPARREMIPQTATLDISREEAEAQLALYAEVPKLTEREKNLLAIYDAVIAGTKIIRLETVLNQGGAYRFDHFPKVAVAPVTAERVRFRRFTRVGRYIPGGLSAYYRAGNWQFDLFKEQGWDPAWNRVSHADAEALTPLVPPPDRDKVEDGDLFLWEATWVNQRETVINYDPAVIRPLSNGLYKVVLAWDLTKAEAMMLGGE